MPVRSPTALAELTVPYDPGPMAMNLDGKVALITGGSNGIGEGVARHLAGQGAHVVLADIDDARGKALADELGGHFVHTDVADPAASISRRGRGRGRHSAASIWLTSMLASPPGAAWATTSIPRPTAAPCPSISTASSTASRRPAGPSRTRAAGPSWPPPPWPAWSPHRSIRSTAPTSMPWSASSDPSARATRADGIRVHALCPSFAYTNIIKGSEQTLHRHGFPDPRRGRRGRRFPAHHRLRLDRAGLVRRGRPRERALRVPPRSGSSARLTDRSLLFRPATPAMGPAGGSDPEPPHHG